MKRLIFGLLFAIFGVSTAFAACPAGTYFTTNGNNCILVAPTDPLPIGSGFTQTARAPDLTATNTTGSVALGASAYVARVCNTSSTISAYVALGNSTVTVTTANGILIPAGQCANLNIGTATYLAGITSASSAVLQTSIGSGLASLGGGGSSGGGGSGTVTSVSVITQNGVSASVANPTTTPALTFTLGAITPSSAAIGAGSAITSSGPGGALTALGYTSPGTGVATALGVNVGSAGAFVTFNGALGTPSSGTLTSATGLPISTGLTGAGTGVLTALGVNVGSAGAFVVNGGDLGTPSAGVATNLSGTAASLTAGHVTTNANSTGDITSVGNATTLAAGSASNLNSGTLAAARGGAGTINGVLSGNGSGVVSQGACAGLTDCTSGTWTPVVSTTSTVGTPAYSVQFGSWRKRGDLYEVQGQVALSGWSGSPTGSVLITGLPATSGSTTGDFGGCNVGAYTVASTGPPRGVIFPNNSRIDVYTTTTTANGAMTAAGAGTTFAMTFACTYHT